MKTNEIFENLVKIEPKVVSIETLFNNEDTLKNTKYAPDYQRNYVWDDDKATYFIESILLGTEIPPIIYFRNGDKIEVIDGRQRYETILRFLNNGFKLKPSGLHKLDKIGITKKYFKDIGELRDDFWDTKLRIIEFSFHTKSSSDQKMEEMEDIVKKEIFKRYNSGITPLKATEIDKAKYFDDDLNTFIQEKLKKDRVLLGEIKDLFYFEKSSIEVLLKKIRQLLVQHKIPIKYYSVKKDIVISKYYEILSSKVDEGDYDDIFSGIISKINILTRVKKVFSDNDFFFNRLVAECIFWALSILEENDYLLKNIDSNFINNLAAYFDEQKSVFEMDRSSFSKELQTRYSVTAGYFSKKCDVSFSDYLITTTTFKKENKEKKETASTESKETSFDDLRINKPEPSSITIVDICRQMERQRFLIRPPYQRTEVKNRNKSSAIIESILLGIKLPPIFVYKRKDGVSEVLDGQQRLLSILGFLKKEYLDENNGKQKSNKNGYSLSLKNGILENLHGQNVDKLQPELVKKINNFDLWIIEINHRYNTDFEPIDLFLRLNSKPYPIKPNTFEMWNSYINKDIIERVKSILKDNAEWFYFRKNNKRMENENIYMSLIYLQYFDSNEKVGHHPPLEYYKIGDKINFRIRSKTEITTILEDPQCKEGILKACGEFNTDFILKVKAAVEDNEPLDYERLSKNLESIFNVSSSGRRTQQSFYALWLFMSKLKLSSIKDHKLQIRQELKNLFTSMNKIETKELFADNINIFWKKYNN
ncbi:GmrSD restriction endonuclease domain-containing protein [Desulfocicer niacini]